MGRGFSFRLMYRVVFFSFCLIFACFYHGGGSEYNRREDKTEQNKLKDEFNSKSLNVEQNIGVRNLRENAKQIDGEDTKKETDLSKMARKETVMKTLRSERIRKSPEQNFSTSSSEVKVPSKEPTTISHSSETKWQNNGMKNISSLENQLFHQNDLRGAGKLREKLASLTTQHLRNRREIDAILENKEGLTKCANFTFTIKYKDDYSVWNNFSIMYRGRMYSYDEYRITDDGLHVCNSSDRLIKEKWRNFTAREKIMTIFTHCQVSVDGFYFENYTLLKNFTIFFHPTEQNFTRQDYGVIFGHFAICSAKLSMSCNDDLVKVKYDEQYNVLENLSLFYNNTIYDFREYRHENEGLEMCASNDSRIQAIWRTRNAWEKFKDRYKCRESVGQIHARNYTVNKQFTVYLAPRSQYFTRNNYGVKDGKPYICQEKLRPASTEYTQEDLLMCNDSIINIKYDDEYKVRTDFSILYKNKVYDYIEYRVLNDEVKICNSTDSSVRNIWKVRNKWVKARMHRKSCNVPILVDVGMIRQKFYTVRKDFSILILATDQVIAKYNYGVFEVKSDENKWKTFLKYSVFSWGVPLIITIVYIVLVKKDFLRFQVDITGCVMGDEPPLWLAVMEKFGLSGCLGLSIAVMFSFTAYRIRQKLKASSSIAQKSNIVKKRNSFVLLLKLSTTTAISLSPLLFENTHLDFDIKMGLFTAAFLTGVYIGIVMKILQRKRIQKSPKLPSPSEVKVPSKESTNIPHANETNGKPLNVDKPLQQDESVSNLTENAKQVDGENTKKETDLSAEMARKVTVMKTLRSERIRKSPELHFSTPSPPEVKVPSKVQVRQNGKTMT
ncbi:Hypothetical predicted protein, partial [Paramuricea clavata]